MQAKITTRFVHSLIPKEKPFGVFDTALPGFLLRVEPPGRMTYYLAEKQASHVKTGVDIQAVRKQNRTRSHRQNCKRWADSSSRKTAHGFWPSG